MALEFFKNEDDTEFQEVFLGDGSYSIKVPNAFSFYKEGERDTLAIYPKGSSCITVRIDLVDLETQGVNTQLTNGHEFVLFNLIGSKKDLSFEQDLAIAFSEEKIVEEGTDLLMKYWEIGPKNKYLMLMSATIFEDKKDDKQVKQLLAAIPDLIKSIEPTEKLGTIPTTSSTDPSISVKQKPTEQEVIELTSEEKKYIKTWFENGKNIIRYYTANSENIDLSFELLDSVFSAWLDDDNEVKFDSDSIANGLGAVFGELLVEKMDMKWMRVIDEHGEDYAVRSPEYVTSYPISSVYKRIGAREFNFFTGIVDILTQAIEEAKSK